MGGEKAGPKDRGQEPLLHRERGAGDIAGRGEHPRTRERICRPGGPKPDRKAPDARQQESENTWRRLLNRLTAPHRREELTLGG